MIGPRAHRSGAKRDPAEALDELRPRGAGAQVVMADVVERAVLIFLVLDHENGAVSGHVKFLLGRINLPQSR